MPNKTKVDVLRNSAALHLVGEVSPDYPQGRFRDSKGRLFSVVLASERPPLEVIQKRAYEEPHWTGFVHLFNITSPKDTSVSFEVWVPSQQRKLWAAQVKKSIVTNPSTDLDEDESAKIR